MRGKVLVLCWVVIWGCGVVAAAEDFDLGADGDFTWEGLLEKAQERAKKSQSAMPAAGDIDEKEAAAPGFRAKTKSVFDNIRQKFSHPPTEVEDEDEAREGVYKTHYPTGELQSIRTFRSGHMTGLEWYSLKGILIWEGEFESGRLVHRKRYHRYTGELESEW